MLCTCYLKPRDPADTSLSGPSWDPLLVGFLFISQGCRKARVVDPISRFYSHIFSETARGVWSPAVRVLAVCILSPQQPQEEFRAARLTARVVLGVHGKEDFERYKMKRFWGWLLFYENLNLLGPKSSQVGVIGHISCTVSWLSTFLLMEL